MSGEDFEVSQVEDTVPTRRLVTIACVGAVITVVCVIISGALEQRHLETMRDGARSYPAPAPSGTVERSLVLASDRGRDLRASQRRTLQSYAWVDRAHGIARIPIDRAEDLIVERGP